MSAEFPTAGGPQASTVYTGTDPIYGATLVIRIQPGMGTVTASVVVSAPVGDYRIKGVVTQPAPDLGNAFFPTAGFPVASAGIEPGNVIVGGLTGTLTITGRLGTVRSDHILPGAFTGSLSIAGRVGITSGGSTPLALLGAVTITGRQGLVQANAITAPAPLGSVVILPWAGTAVLASVVYPPVGPVAITGKIGTVQATATVMALKGVAQIVGQVPTVLSQSFIDGLKGSLVITGKNGLTQADVILSTPKGNVVINGKNASVQAGITTPGLGNAFFPVGGYPMASPGPGQGDVDVGGLTGSINWTMRLGTGHAGSTSYPGLGSLMISGKNGTVTASAIIVQTQVNHTLITGLTGTESSSSNVLAPKGSVVITPKLGTTTAGSTATGFRGIVTINGLQGSVEASDVICAGPGGRIVFTGLQPVVISNNNIPAKVGHLTMLGRQGTTSVANRRRKGRLVTALKA